MDFYCVLDGHGPNGEVVAKWLLNELPSAIQNAVTSYEGNLNEARPSSFQLMHSSLDEMAFEVSEVVFAE